jgi:PPOX class probable F420-dependent enzyme
MTAILSPAARAALTSGRVAHLVTNGADGYPHITCVYVGLDGDTIVSGHLDDYVKLRNVRRDPRVALSVHTGEHSTFGSAYLVVVADATVETGGAPPLLRGLTDDYFGEDFPFPPPGAAPGYVLRMTPRRIGGVGDWAVSDAAGAR